MSLIAICFINCLLIPTLLTKKNELTRNITEYYENTSKYVLAIFSNAQNNMSRLCAGTMILPDWILTSNTCLRSQITHTSTLEALRITFDGQLNASEAKRFVIRTIQYPEYKQFWFTIKHDVALLNLQLKFRTEMSRDVVSLASRKLTEKKRFWDETKIKTCDYMFWPFSEIDLRNTEALYRTRNARVMIIPKSVCKIKIGGFAITREQICVKLTTGEGKIGNHSGGPLICGELQVAFFTWQINNALNETILVFTKVDVYEGFLRGIVQHLYFAKDFPVSRRRKHRGSIDSIVMKNSNNKIVIGTLALKLVLVVMIV